MNILDILSPNAIKVPLEASDKKSAIDELIDLIAGAGLISHPEALKKVVWERELQRTRATEDLVRKLLPVADDFDRALRSMPEEIAGHPWVEGMRLVERKLWRTLEGQGISVMESVGQPFDPSLHEAVMVDESAGDADTVVEEFQRGYFVNDTVLRPAMVKVGSGSTLNMTTAGNGADS